MVLLGDTEFEKCEIRYVDGKTYVKGPREGFIGYKIENCDGNNGVFIQWKIENDTLILENDSFGFFPLFYTKDEEGVSFSSSILDLIQPSGEELDDTAIAVFIRFGSFVGNSTAFSRIKALPPGARLKFSRGKFELTSHKIEVGKPQNISYQDALDQYGDLFEKAVDKYRGAMVNKTTVPLSGGCDSRHILLAMVASDMSPSSTITMKHQPPKSDEDVEIAQQLAQFLGIEHSALEYSRSFLKAEIEKNKLTNFCTLDHSWFIPLSNYFIENNYKGVFDGVAGDVLSAGLFLTEKKIKTLS